MIRLSPLPVEKPWGRTCLPGPFEAAAGKRIGEIWFQGPAGAAPLSLLVKYIFTSEKLSIQVHPSDAQARARGLPEGKEECWYILDAEPGAQLGIGTIRHLDTDELLNAARTGAIQQLIEWHPVEQGMLFHIPPGTVHAIGAGISLVEIQQNSDITYRLYDYGRPRELHLINGADVARACPFPASQQTKIHLDRSSILLKAKHFTIAQITDDGHPIDIAQERPIFVAPICGTTFIDDQPATPGECMIANCDSQIVPGIGSRAFLVWDHLCDPDLPCL